MHLFSTRLSREGSRVLQTIRLGAETSGQTQVRLVVLLLVTLGAAAAAFELDAVLGAFAAGIILRGLLPQGHEGLEVKLNGLAFGLLIPVFFITSGMGIDPAAVAQEPAALVVFVLLILLVRGGSIWAATATVREDGQRVFTGRESASLALFGSTGLPIIVAVTSVAVSSGQMSEISASVLVAGGAFTVLLCPRLAQQLLTRREPSDPGAEQAHA